jgi:hypothetical protein
LQKCSTTSEPIKPDEPVANIIALLIDSKAEIRKAAKSKLEIGKAENRNSFQLSRFLLSAFSFPNF